MPNNVLRVAFQNERQFVVKLCREDHDLSAGGDK
jgi:hypothetical protein